jgi:tetratricopeptide (TPR) repeat protein
MRWVFLAAALCLPGPARGQFASDPVKAKVIAKDGELKRAEQLARWAEQMKNIAANKAMTAKQRADMARRRRKEEAKQAAAAAREELKRAEQDASAKKLEVNQTGLEYLQAEDRHYAQNGTYVKPQQYEYLKQKLQYESAPPPEPTEAAIASQQAELQHRLESGEPIGAGELAGRAGQLKQMGFGVINKSLDTDYGKGAGGDPARFAGGGGEAGSPAGRAPAAAGPPAGAALASGTAALLRKPVGDMDRAASKRFAAAGRDALDLGNAKDALLSAEEAVRADPDNPNAWGLKAEALNRLGRFGEAEESAQRAVDLDPGNAKGLRALVWAQLHNKKPAEAAANATRLIRLDPENAESFLLRAFAYELAGDRERMLADLRQAAARDPRFANHLARALAGLRLFDPDGDNSALLGMLAAPPAGRTGVPWGLAALLAAAAGAAGAAWKFRGRARDLARELFARKRTVGVGHSSSAPAPAAEESPALLAGKYRLDRVAGQGGMGRVWKAFDMNLERAVAVKEMSPEAAARPELRALYLREARALASVQHVNLVEIFEVIETPEQVYLVMEWVSGKTLQQVLAEKGALGLGAAKAVLAPVCEALAAAHARGLVHRDLKPANLMVSSSGRVKLIDFGIARELGATAAEGTAPESGAAPSVLTAARTRTLAGTPAYAPPEARQGLVSPLFDVFSLGVCLYELVTNRLPFGPAGGSGDDARLVPASEAVPGLPAAVDALLASALAFDPEARPRDALSFRDALLKP